MPTSTGRFVYDEGQKWLRENDPHAPLAAWSEITPKERQYWEVMGRAIQTAIAGQRWDGVFCGLTVGFVFAAIVFMVAGH